jgi:nucleotide-binding universal stress UspA family protein
MKKILVPTDLSPAAEVGLKLAAQIAARAQASISLVNFTQHPFNKTFTAMGDAYAKIDSEADRFHIQLLHANKKKLEELASKYNKDVFIEFSIVDNEFKKGMDEYLKQENIDLIVMGTTGEETAKELFIGNHTEQVTSISHCPVISVRDGFNIHHFDNMVLAVNVIEKEMIVHGIESLKSLAVFFNARIHLVHVVNSASESVKDLTDYFKMLVESAGLVRYSVTVLEAEDQAEGVILFAQQIKAGLVAVIKNSHNSIFRIFSPHFSDRMVKETGRPVFTVNTENGFSQR